LIIDSTKSSPWRSALSVVCLFSSKLGLYCGEVVEISQPLLPMGMKTPISMGADVQFPDRCSKRDQSARVFAQLWISSIAP
jgi:hypothetical protein